MPSILTHPFVALTRTWFPRVAPRAVALGALATVLPDADVVAFAFGIPYGSTFGHRGFTHSILFAVLVAALLTRLVRGGASTFAFLFLCAISHPLLDAMTNGGLGIAFFSPFDRERYFLPWRPIRVSPIGARFFSERGLATLVSEMGWVWGPMIVVGLLGKYLRKGDVEAGEQR